MNGYIWLLRSYDISHSYKPIGFTYGHSFLLSTFTLLFFSFLPSTPIDEPIRLVGLRVAKASHLPLLQHLKPFGRGDSDIPSLPTVGCNGSLDDEFLGMDCNGLTVN